MDAALYPQMAALEQQHWWFVARRQIIERRLQQLHLPANATILEAGCGTGGNLDMLARHGQVWAMELNAEARVFASRHQGATVAAGALPDQIPFAPQQFDLIVLLDVLEHLEDDQAALLALRQRLKPGGRLLLTVPAFPLLWSEHDTRHHHYRRYRRPSLRDGLVRAGFRLDKLSYFNFWLFPAVLAARLLQRALGRAAQDDLALSPPWLNGLLRGLFGSERYLLDYVSLPVGVSLLAVAQRVE